MSFAMKLSFLTRKRRLVFVLSQLRLTMGRDVSHAIYPNTGVQTAKHAIAVRRISFTTPQVANVRGVLMKLLCFPGINALPVPKELNI